MSERNKKTECVILSVRDIAEGRRAVTVLSRDRGLFDSTLYGGAKSHLRSLVQPFYGGILSVYISGAAGTAKITDFEAQKYRLSFRESLFKMWAASFACEVVIKTKGGGGGDGAYILLSAFLDGLDAVSEEAGKSALLRFLWRYLNLLGLAAEPRACSNCGTSLLSRNRSAYYVLSRDNFVCENCYAADAKRDPKGDFELDLDSVTYLCAIKELPPSSVRKLPLPPSSQDKLKRFLFFEIQKACGAPLEALKWR